MAASSMITPTDLNMMRCARWLVSNARTLTAARINMAPTISSTAAVTGTSMAAQNVKDMLSSDITSGNMAR